MRYEHEGRSLWFAMADAPAPAGEIETADRVEVTVAVQPADASNRIEIRYKVNDERIKIVPAAWVRNEPGKRIQFFRGEIAGLNPGDTVRYVPVCHCAGRSFPSGAEIERLDGSFRIAGGPAASTAAPPAMPDRIEMTAAGPALSPRGTGLTKRLTSTDLQSRPVASPAPTASQPIPTIAPVDRPTAPAPALRPDAKAAAAPVALSDLAPKLRLERGAELLRALDKHGIRTLDDVRKAGGLAKLADLPVAHDHPAVKTLEAHAQLAVISPDPDLNAKLIDKGYDDIASLALARRGEFIRAMRDDIGEEDARGILGRAKAAGMIMDNLIVDELLGGARMNRLSADDPDVRRPSWPISRDGPSVAEGASSGSPATAVPAENPPVEASCDCRDCNSALSPLAYLAVLVDYAVRNVKNNGNSIDLAFLENTLHQPFAELSGSCSQLEDRQLQVRLCIEVLYRYRKRTGAAPLGAAEVEYLTQAYLSLLSAIGTSYDELRQARSRTDQERQVLSQRIGVHAAMLDLLLLKLPPTLDSFQALEKWEFFVTRPQSGFLRPVQPRSPGEQRSFESVLEDLFGLVSTSRDALRPPPVSGIWATRPDYPRPYIKAWRLEYLRNSWWAQDWPTDPYDPDYQDAERRRVIIDPDLIGPDDFRHPLSTSQGTTTFDLWLRRRRWVDDEIHALRALTRTVNGRNAPDVPAMLGRMSQPITPYAGVGLSTAAPALVSAWPDATTIADLYAIQDLLDTGTASEPERARLRIESKLRMSVEAFARLLILVDKNSQAELDIAFPALTDKECMEIISILVSAQKKCLQLVWLEEERTADIDLDPRIFWSPLRQPEMGEWPPVTPPELPLIDPQILDITALCEPTVGTVAIRFWQERHRHIATVERELRAARRASGLAGMLLIAFGDPLPYDFDALARDLDDPDRLVPGTNAEAAAQAIHDDLKISIPDFRLLMDVQGREKSDPRRRPSRDEWLQAIAVLVSAQKRRVLYPSWKLAERNVEQGVEPLEYWQAIKARLPLWRVTMEERRGWERALQRRRLAPIIDPDALTVVDFKTPVTTDPAFSLWSRRKDWWTLGSTTGGGAPASAAARSRSGSAPSSGSVLERLISPGSEMTFAPAAAHVSPALPEALAARSNEAATRLDRKLTSILVVSQRQLIDLANDDVPGTPREQRLKQLDITSAEFNILINARDEARSSSAYAEDAVDSVLRNVTKRRRFAAWRAEEKRIRLTLSPDFFTIPDEEPEEIANLSDRDRSARWTWQNTLQARIGQDEAVASSVNSYIQVVEEKVLPLLRAALVAATSPGSGNLSAKAKWVREYLCIDAETAACYRISRVDQAIQTIQQFLWSIRHRFSRDADILSTLVLDDDQFDHVWAWLGSYQSWRSAVLTYLYPERLLDPLLRKQEYQSPGFRALREDLHNKSIGDARDNFDKYYNDLSRFDNICSCYVPINDRDGLVFLYATSMTGNHYWSVFSAEEFSTHKPRRLFQSFWYPARVFPEKTQLLGAVRFHSVEGDDCILIFGQHARQDGQELMAVKHPLNASCQPPWREIPQLETVPAVWNVPFGRQKYTALVVQQSSAQPPILVLKGENDEALYEAKANDYGNGWAEGYPRRIGTVDKSLTLRAAISVAQDSQSPYFLIAQFGERGLIKGCTVSPARISTWIGLESGEWLATFALAGSVYATLRRQENGNAIAIELKQSPGSLKFWPPNNFADWVWEVTGVELRHIDLTESLRLTVSAHDFRPGRDTVNLEDFLFTEDWVYPETVFRYLFACPRVDDDMGKYECCAVDDKHEQEPQTNLLENEDYILTWAELGRVLIDNISAYAWTATADELVRRGTTSGYGIKECLTILLDIETNRRRNRIGTGYKDDADNLVEWEVFYQSRLIHLSVNTIFRGTTLAIANNLQFATHSGNLLLPWKREGYWAIGQLTDKIDDEIDVYERTGLTLPEVAPDSSSELDKSARLLERVKDWSIVIEIVVAERYYFEAMLIALALQKNGQYQDALDKYKLVYNYDLPPSARKQWAGLVLEEGSEEGLTFVNLWTFDPFDPHLLASTRRNCYTKYTLASIVQCLLDWSDAEFSRDERQSRDHAKTLYHEALRLLSTAELNGAHASCSAAADLIDNPLLTKSERQAFRRYVTSQGGSTSVIAALLKKGSSLDDVITAAHAAIDAVRATNPPPTIGSILAANGANVSSRYTKIISDTDMAGAVAAVAGSLGGTSASDEAKDPFASTVGTVPYLLTRFCVMPNPVTEGLRSRANISLFYLNNCRNIAGMLRTSEDDDLTGAVVRRQPSMYRFTKLIERASQLVEQASRMESAMLAALQQRDAANYQLLQAKQNLEMAHAIVAQQDLNIQRARGDVAMATLQRARSQAQLTHFQNLLSEGLSELELASLSAQYASSILDGIAGFIPGEEGIDWTKAIGGLAGGTGSLAAALGQQAGYERRAQDWQLQSVLAAHDIQTGNQQYANAQTQVLIAEREKEIAMFRVGHARDVLTFLSNDILGADFYDWMSNRLEEIYRYYLQRATTVTRLAVEQLAFERQEDVPVRIQADYWNAASAELLAGDVKSGAPDRRGITGSAQLMADIDKLKDHADETKRWKHFEWEEISLAQLDPVAFQQFKQTGVMRFRTAAERFDRKLPGSYLRLIERVRPPLVIAVIPAGASISATLSNVGVSRVITGSPGFEICVQRRDPAQMAWTIGRGATATDLPAEADMLRPFEALGVETAWEFCIPKSNKFFNFDSIADVIITLDYSALLSEDYKEKIYEGLKKQAYHDQRFFSFRQTFADGWYDLHNPDQSATPMTVRFRIRPEDLVGFSAPIIQAVEFLAVPAAGKHFEVDVDHLSLLDGETAIATGRAAMTRGGYLSTRQSNGASWVPLLGSSPYGEWQLAFSDTSRIRSLFRDEEIADLFFFLTCSESALPQL